MHEAENGRMPVELAPALNELLIAAVESEEEVDEGQIKETR